MAGNVIKSAENWPVYPLNSLFLPKIFLFSKTKEHYNLTNSNHAKNLIDNWDKEKYLFWQIVPKEMTNKFRETVLVKNSKIA